MSLTFTGAVPIPKAQTSPLSIVVTGAARGIGYELVVQYAKAYKDNVVIAGVRDTSSSSVKALSAYPNVHVVQLDVSKEASIRASVLEVERVTPHVDLLINNAGVFGPLEASDPLQTTAEALESVFHTNVTGVLLTTQAYLPLLRKSSAAKVANISSSLGSNAHANLFGPVTAYGLSKAALNYLTTAFRHAEPKVTFTAIHPGWVQTDMGSSVGSPPTLLPESVQAIRYYIAEKGIQHSGEYIDTMTGNIIPY
jgi:NAD(P)-dependent dehydrogenase (short-subunit alcohol dehydrogenase family)